MNPQPGLCLNQYHHGGHWEPSSLQYIQGRIKHEQQKTTLTKTAPKYTTVLTTEAARLMQVEWKIWDKTKVNGFDVCASTRESYSYP